MATLSACSDADAPEDRTDGFTHNAKTLEDSLFQDIMDGHDAAMAKMGKLVSYRKKALQKVDSLQKSKAAQAWVDTFSALSANLASAEQNMNVWMEGFILDSAKEDLNRRVAYLESEKKKVEKVKNQVLGVIARADSLLRK
jgi:hypothetical protein